MERIDKMKDILLNALAQNDDEEFLSAMELCLDTYPIKEVLAVLGGLLTQFYKVTHDLTQNQKTKVKPELLS